MRFAASAGTCCTRREPPKKSYVENLLAKEQGAFVAVSDNIRTVPDQIAPWVPGGLFTLGTDGFGRSDTRARLRRFFEVDAESTVIGTLYALAEKDLIETRSRRAGHQGFGRRPGKNPAATGLGGVIPVSLFSRKIISGKEPRFPPSCAAC